MRFLGVGVALLVGLALAPPAWADHRGQVPWVYNLERGQEEAQRTRRPVMLYFSANWCPHCRAFGDGALSDSGVLEAIRGAVVPVLIDCSRRGSNRALQERYGVEGVPAVVFLDAAGQRIGRLRNRGDIPGVRQQILNAGGAPAGSAGGGGRAPFYAFLAGMILLALGANVLALWSTVRLLDGFNQANTWGSALTWVVISNVLALPANFIPPGGIGGLALIFVNLGVLLVYFFAVFFRHYQLSVGKSVLAIPLYLFISVVLLILGWVVLFLGLNQLVGPERVKAWTQEAYSLSPRRSFSGPPPAESGPDEPPATRSGPSERPRPGAMPRDLSQPAKPVEGLPGHYSYKDAEGKAHIVDDYDKVPPEYRY